MQRPVKVKHHRMYAVPIVFCYSLRLPCESALDYALRALFAGPRGILARTGKFQRPAYNVGVHRPVNVRGPRVTRQFPVPE